MQDGACSNIAYKVLFAKSLDALTFGDQVEEEGKQRRLRKVKKGEIQKSSPAF